MNKLLYIPSFSAATSGRSYQLNHYIFPDLPSRFWQHDYPKHLQHHAFLITAGHDYKQTDIYNNYGFHKDVLVFGDSGGFQIASGQLNWTPETKEELRKNIFEWLEKNSNVAMNLDLPPFKASFDYSLKESIDNFKYFNKYQSGKTKFLNILQGNTVNEQLEWYNSVKQFEFNGWALGGCIKKPYQIVAKLAILLKHKEHLKRNVNYLHFLGVSDIVGIFLMTQIQKSLNEIGVNIQVTSDSSSPSQSVAFGRFYTEYNLKSQKISSINIPKHSQRNKQNGGIDINTDIDYTKRTPFPVLSDFDIELNKRGYTIEEMTSFNLTGYSVLVHHNFHVQLNIFRDIDYYVNSQDFILSQIVPNNLFKLLKLIDTMIKSSNPFKIFNDNHTFIKSISNKKVTKTKTKQETTNKLFNF